MKHEMKNNKKGKLSKITKNKTNEIYNIITSQNTQKRKMFSNNLSEQCLAKGYPSHLFK